MTYGTTQIKVWCYSCNGTGEYRADGQTEGVPCWTCRGRGFVSTTVPKPNPKWAKLYDKARKEK